MKTWLLKFVADHGNRIVFMLIASFFGCLFYYLGLHEEGKTILTLVAGVAVNQCRSPKGDR